MSAEFCKQMNEYCVQGKEACQNKEKMQGKLEKIFASQTPGTEITVMNHVIKKMMYVFQHHHQM